jgi:putative lipoprotein
MAVVQVTAVVPAGAPARTAARVAAEVRDTSLADAPSVVVGTEIREAVPVAPGARLVFRIGVPEPDPRRSYGVRVHVDMDGDGAVGPGDLLSTQAHPVLTGGAPAQVTVPLSAIEAP